MGINTDNVYSIDDPVVMFGDARLTAAWFYNAIAQSVHEEIGFLHFDEPPADLFQDSACGRALDGELFEPLSRYLAYVLIVRWANAADMGFEEALERKLSEYRESYACFESGRFRLPVKHDDGRDYNAEDNFCEPDLLLSEFLASCLRRAHQEFYLGNQSQEEAMMYKYGENGEHSEPMFKIAALDMASASIHAKLAALAGEAASRGCWMFLRDAHRDAPAQERDSIASDVRNRMLSPLSIASPFAFDASALSPLAPYADRGCVIATKDYIPDAVEQLCSETAFMTLDTLGLVPDGSRLALLVSLDAPSFLEPAIVSAVKVAGWPVLYDDTGLFEDALYTQADFDAPSKYLDGKFYSFFEQMPDKTSGAPEKVSMTSLVGLGAFIPAYEGDRQGLLARFGLESLSEKAAALDAYKPLHALLSVFSLACSSSLRESAGFGCYRYGEPEFSSEHAEAVVDTVFKGLFDQGFGYGDIPHFTFPWFASSYLDYLRWYDAMREAGDDTHDEFVERLQALERSKHPEFLADTRDVLPIGKDAEGAARWDNVLRAAAFAGEMWTGILERERAERGLSRYDGLFDGTGIDDLVEQLEGLYEKHCVDILFDSYRNGVPPSIILG